MCSISSITTSRITLEDGRAVPPDAPGLGIEWDFARIDAQAVARATISR